MITDSNGISSGVSLFCCWGMTVLLLGLYGLLAYGVTRGKDFFIARRWKAAVSFAVITGSILAALYEGFLVLLLLSRPVEFPAWPVRVMGIQPLYASVLVFLLYTLTFGVFLQLQTFSMDEVLEKIWPDPDKGHRSPIRDRW